MANFAPSPFAQGQQVQVIIEGLPGFEKVAGSRAAVGGRVTQVVPRWVDG